MPPSLSPTSTLDCKPPSPFAHFRGRFLSFICSGRAEYSSVWKCAQAGFGYFATQLAKLLILATFFPSSEHEGMATIHHRQGCSAVGAWQGRALTSCRSWRRARWTCWTGWASTCSSSGAWRGRGRSSSWRRGWAGRPRTASPRASSPSGWAPAASASTGSTSRWDSSPTSPSFAASFLLSCPGLSQVA